MFFGKFKIRQRGDQAKILEVFLNPTRYYSGNIDLGSGLAQSPAQTSVGDSGLALFKTIPHLQTNSRNIILHPLTKIDKLKYNNTQLKYNSTQLEYKFT